MIAHRLRLLQVARSRRARRRRSNAPARRSHRLAWQSTPLLHIVTAAARALILVLIVLKAHVGPAAVRATARAAIRATASRALLWGREAEDGAEDLVHELAHKRLRPRRVHEPGNEQREAEELAEGLRARDAKEGAEQPCE